MVEDLINSPPFYPAWLAERGESWDGPLVPHLARGQMARIGDGCQVGGHDPSCSFTSTALLQP